MTEYELITIYCIDGEYETNDYDEAEQAALDGRIVTARTYRRPVGTDWGEV